jgi:hypothetical protein
MKSTQVKKQEYLDEIRSWSWVKAKDEAFKDREFDQEADSMIGRVYLGTIFNLTPSGKFYMPFACSNVDPCPHCEGSGVIKNTEADNRITQVLTNAEHEIRMTTLKLYGAFWQNQWPAPITTLLATMSELLEENKPERTCPHCDGLGSEEARWDELWHEALEEVCGENGGFVDHFDENIFFATMFADDRGEDFNEGEAA